MVPVVAPVGVPVSDMQDHVFDLPPTGPPPTSKRRLAQWEAKQEVRGYVWQTFHKMADFASRDPDFVVNTSLDVMKAELGSDVLWGANTAYTRRKTIEMSFVSLDYIPLKQAFLDAKAAFEAASATIS